MSGRAFSKPVTKSGPVDTAYFKRPVIAPRSAATPEERAAIEAFLAKKDVRRFREGESGDRFTLLEWLQNLDIAIRWQSGRPDSPEACRWLLDGRTIRVKEFDALVNRERARMGKAPIALANGRGRGA